MLTLMLDEIFNFVGSDQKSRNIKEGQKVLTSKNLIRVGQTSKNQSEVHVYALCLQTSALSAPPHLIEGIIVDDPLTQSASIKKMSCTCKAGQSQQCKHIVAFLLHCTQNDIQALEVVSSTERKCMWGQLKGQALAQYKPAPLSLSCCCQQQKFPQLSANDNKRIYDLFVDLDGESSLELHKKRLRKTSLSAPTQLSSSLVLAAPNVTILDAVLTNVARSDIMREIENIPVGVRDCCLTRYNSLFLGCDALNIAELTQNNETKWKEHRQFRITGSRCYSLFTYGKNKKPDWDQKASSYFWDKGFTNKYVRHGIAMEPRARELYAQYRSVTVVCTGLIVSDLNPWLGYSPDGIVLQGSNPHILLEIKCPYDLADLKSENLLEACDYLTLKEKKIVLKVKHKYYAQVQFGLAVLNLKSCDFVIYSSKADDIVILKVKYDEDFANSLFSTLKKNYFEKMLHVICKNKEFQDSSAM